MQLCRKSTGQLVQGDPHPLTVSFKWLHDLQAKIAARVREDCSPRHVPDEVHAIAAVPRTLSGKALEIPVKRILMGTPPERTASRESLANPEALDWFVAFSGR